MMVSWEMVRFWKASSHALQCNASLIDLMYKDSWSWKGKCKGCQRHFAPGLPDGTFEHSKTKAPGWHGIAE